MSKLAFEKEIKRPSHWFVVNWFRFEIHSTVGTSTNAVKIQIWTASIAMLILRFLQLRSQFGWSLSNLLALLRMNLFTHRDLWTWLDHPLETAPIPYEPEQLRMTWA